MWDVRAVGGGDGDTPSGLPTFLLHSVMGVCLVRAHLPWATRTPARNARLCEQDGKELFQAQFAGESQYDGTEPLRAALTAALIRDTMHLCIQL